MKLVFSNERRRQAGSAVILFLGLLAIMLICVSVNTASLRGLNRELKLLDKKQAQRWQPGQTNNAGEIHQSHE